MTRSKSIQELEKLYTHPKPGVREALLRGVYADKDCMDRYWGYILQTSNIDFPEIGEDGTCQGDLIEFYPIEDEGGIIGAIFGAIFQIVTLIYGGILKVTEVDIDYAQGTYLFLAGSLISYAQRNALYDTLSREDWW
jgi:hypothetical protein